MEDVELDRRVEALPERLAAIRADPYKQAEIIAFRAKYDLGSGRHGTVTVEVGAMAPVGGMYLVWYDEQSVTIDDPRVMFIVTGRARAGRLVDLRYTAKPGGPFLDRLGELLRDGLDGHQAVETALAEDLPGATHEVTQHDLRAMPVVSMVKNWAVVGREFQEALKRYAADRGVTYASGYSPLGLDPDDATDPAQLAEAMTEETGILDRLFDDHNHAIGAVRNAFAKLAAPGRQRRGSSVGEDDLLVRRVVDEYKDAVSRGVRAPRRFVAERLRYHETHIGRLLAQARTAGMLPPAKPRGRRNRINPDDRPLDR